MKRIATQLPWILVALTATLAARADTRPMESADVALLRNVESVAMSPDGQRIAYVLRVPRLPGVDDDGPLWYELHVIGPSGPSRPFVTGHVSVGQIAWKPDGSGVSFVAKMGEDEHAAIHFIPTDGGESRRIVAHEADIEAYDWSPDGARIAFCAAAKPDAREAERRKLGFDAQVFEEDSQPLDVWIAEVAPHAPHARRLGLPGSAGAVRWSPAGDRLAVTLSKTPQIDDAMMFSRIHFVDPTRGADTGQVEHAGKLGAMQFSPDGKHLAFLGGADLNDPSEGRLWVISVSGGAPRQLLPGYAGDVQGIQWQSADTVMYVGHEGVWSSFGKVSLDGATKKTIVPAGPGPIWRSFALARDGMSSAIVADTPAHPAEVFTMKHGDNGPRRLTDSNPWLADVRLAPQEVFAWKARDGLELEGVLTRPLDARPGQRVPLVLGVHGGPESHLSNGWVTSYHTPAQAFAARGFAVFQPNYRGSTGRGVEFSKLGQGDAAGAEFDDLIDAVDALIAAGIIDEKKVGVTGGSYGGYATAWCCTRYSDRFAAGVMSIGISELISKYGTTDIPNEENLVHSRAWPWDNWERFEQRSPLRHVQNAHTPLLIAAGRDDTRVHPSQSLQLYRYLKLLGETPVRLVLYPGEGHGNRKSAARYDYTLRVMQWMEHYLSGPGGEPPPYRIEYDLEPFRAATQPSVAP